MERAVFWSSLAFILYTYVGYPLILWVWSTLKHDRSRPSPEIRDWAGKRPTSKRVAIIIAACNEATVIAEKIQNVLSLDYPKDRMKVIVVSDGSTDGTDEVIRSFGGAVRLIALKDRLGKAEALNRAVASTECEIVVLTDARQRLDAQAVRVLIERFRDNRIGAVSGRLVLSAGPEGELREMGLYWRYELFMRGREGRIGSVIGVTGALYAIRRRLWRSMPAGTILDDVFLPMSVVLSGYRVALEPAAVAYDWVSKDLGEEFVRKARSLAGNYQVLWHLPQILIPGLNPVWFQYGSHKIARLIVPFALIALFVSNLTITHGFYGVFLMLQFVWYTLAAFGGIRPLRRVAELAMSGSATITAMNGAAIMGLIYFLSGKKDIWVRDQPALTADRARRRAS